MFPICISFASDLFLSEGGEYIQEGKLHKYDGGHGGYAEDDLLTEEIMLLLLLGKM